MSHFAASQRGCHADQPSGMAPGSEDLKSGLDTNSFGSLVSLDADEYTKPKTTAPKMSPLHEFIIYRFLLQMDMNNSVSIPAERAI